MNSNMDDFDQISITVDVDWSAPEVVNYVVGMLDERGLKATYRLG